MSVTINATVPPPPPPPPTPALREKLNITNNTKTNETKRTSLDECLWAIEWPELQKACYLARVCAIKPPKECQLRIINNQLQTGPTCGLTALSMLCNGNPTVVELLKTAQALNFTNNGELFSADYLYQLVLKYFKKNNDRDDSIQLYKGVLNTNEIREIIMENACIFVPYPFEN